MARRVRLTTHDLPLFSSDEEIGEAVLGFDRRLEFAGLATLHERNGMPKMSPVWGGRYVPAVKAFLDTMYGVGTTAAVPLAPNGIEGNFHVPRRDAKKCKLTPRIEPTDK